MTSTAMDYLLPCGALGALWMACGVYVGGRLYPGYDHRHQAMSELGARGRATTRIHPFINNYPIGILFTAFGVGVWGLAPSHGLPMIAATLLVVHGLSHIIAGAFPLDADLGASGTLSTAHRIHGMAGLLMYFALWTACLSWTFIDTPSMEGFRFYSFASAIVSIVVLGFMARSLKTGRDLGLHQRVSYGILGLWCAVLSILLSAGR